MKGMLLVGEEWSGSLVHEICLWLLPTGTGNSKIRRISGFHSPKSVVISVATATVNHILSSVFPVIDSHESIRYQKRRLPMLLRCFFKMYVFNITLTY